MVTQPASTGVVVIGGGIAGVSAALLLAEAGIATVLCEKGRIAREQSSRNWGWIRKQRRAFEELPLMIESARLWERITSEVAEDIGFRKKGSTYLASNESELAARALWLEQAKGFGVDSRLLDARQTNQLLDQEDGHFIDALLTPSDAYAEPALAVPAMARPAQTWAAMIDVMPDELCTVGALPELPGLVLATGLSGHGFGLGPGVGMLAAQLVSGGTPQEGSEGLDPFRFRNSVCSTTKTDIAAANRIDSLFSA